MKSSVDPIWEEIHSTREWGAYPSEYIIRFVARNFYDAPERIKVKILDFGCGQGANTWYLAREGFDVYAFDGSKSAVEKAKVRMHKDGLHAKFNVYNGTEIGYSDCFFDAIIDNVCIYANPISAIYDMYKNAYRVLKKGGKIITVCFGEDTSGYKTGLEIEPSTYQDIKEGNLKNSGKQHIFKRTEIIELLEKVGFQNIICETGKYTDKGYIVHHYICMAEKAV